MNIPAGNESLTVAESPQTLTDKREMFVDYYCGEARGNATLAARMAGYAVPKQEGTRLLSIAAVRSRIDEQMRALSLSQAEITAGLSQFVRDPANNSLAVVKGYETLARINGMIIERNKVEQSNDITVRVVREHAIKATVQRAGLLADGDGREP